MTLEFTASLFCFSLFFFLFVRVFFSFGRWWGDIIRCIVEQPRIKFSRRISGENQTNYSLWYLTICASVVAVVVVIGVVVVPVFVVARFTSSQFWPNNYAFVWVLFCFFVFYLVLFFRLIHLRLHCLVETNLFDTVWCSGILLVVISRRPTNY